MRPLIGVCASHDTEKNTFFVRENYMESLLRAGALPVLLPMTRDAEVISNIAERIDGLFLAGGGDVDPAYYNTPKHPNCGEIDLLRDDFELALMARVMERKLPVFGVCRGIQLMNVALGGTLIQDIPSEVPVNEIHLQKPPYDEPAHEIEIYENGLLRKILNVSRFAVNSMHHQAVLDPAPGCVVDARSPEGIIEAIYLKDDPRVFGVQFHPEHYSYKSKGAQALFDYFVDCTRS